MVAPPNSDCGGGVDKFSGGAAGDDVDLFVVAVGVEGCWFSLSLDLVTAGVAVPEDGDAALAAAMPFGSRAFSVGVCVCGLTAAGVDCGTTAAAGDAAAKLNVDAEEEADVAAPKLNEAGGPAGGAADLVAANGGGAVVPNGIVDSGVGLANGEVDDAVFVMLPNDGRAVWVALAPKDTLPVCSGALKLKDDDDVDVGIGISGFCGGGCC